MVSCMTKDVKDDSTLCYWPQRIGAGENSWIISENKVLGKSYTSRTNKRQLPLENKQAYRQTYKKPQIFQGMQMLFHVAHFKSWTCLGFRVWAKRSINLSTRKQIHSSLLGKSYIIEASGLLSRVLRLSDWEDPEKTAHQCLLWAQEKQVVKWHAATYFLTLILAQLS
jgi:hypothetical protein